MFGVMEMGRTQVSEPFGVGLREVDRGWRKKEKEKGSFQLY